MGAATEPKYDRVKLRDEFIEGAKALWWGGIEDFVRKANEKDPSRKLIPGSVRAIAAEDNWSALLEAVKDDLRSSRAEERGQRQLNQLYKDQDKVTKLRRKFISQLEAAAGDEAKMAKLGAGLKNATAALHTIEADIDIAIRRPSIEDGKPVVRIILRDEIAPWTHEITPDSPYFPPVGVDGSPRPVETQEGVGGEEDSEDGVRDEVVIATGVAEFLPGGGLVHSPELPVGQADSLEQIQRVLREAAGEGEGGGERDGSGNPTDRRQIHRYRGDGQV